MDLTKEQKEEVLNELVKKLNSEGSLPILDELKNKKLIQSNDLDTYDDIQSGIDRTRSKITDLNDVLNNAKNFPHSNISDFEKRSEKDLQYLKQLEKARSLNLGNQEIPLKADQADTYLPKGAYMAQQGMPGQEASPDITGTEPAPELQKEDDRLAKLRAMIQSGR